MSPPRAEIHNLPALRGPEYARGLAGSHRLITYRREQVRFEYLGFDDWRGHANDRLAREHQGPLRHGPDVPAEPELLEVAEKAFVNVRENRKPAEIFDFIPGKAHIFQELKRLFETRG